MTLNSINIAVWFFYVGDYAVRERVAEQDLTSAGRLNMCREAGKRGVSCLKKDRCRFAQERFSDAEVY
ncbi:hypothetical protein B7764_10670 [Pantoea ananatis]|nr:hypothetical protein B7764_10670 [Pantoea ananatis]